MFPRPQRTWRAWESLADTFDILKPRFRRPVSPTLFRSVALQHISRRLNISEIREPGLRDFQSLETWARDLSVSFLDDLDQYATVFSNGFLRDPLRHAECKHLLYVYFIRRLQMVEDWKENEEGELIARLHEVTLLRRSRRRTVSAVGRIETAPWRRRESHHPLLWRIILQISNNLRADG
jgi:hypothetical protein